MHGPQPYLQFLWLYVKFIPTLSFLRVLGFPLSSVRTKTSTSVWISMVFSRKMPLIKRRLKALYRHTPTPSMWFGHMPYACAQPRHITQATETFFYRGCDSMNRRSRCWLVDKIDQQWCWEQNMNRPLIDKIKSQKDHLTYYLTLSFEIVWIEHHSVTIHPGHRLLVQLSKHGWGVLGTVFPATKKKERK